MPSDPGGASPMGVLRRVQAARDDCCLSGNSWSFPPHFPFALDPTHDGAGPAPTTGLFSGHGAAVLTQVRFIFFFFLREREHEQGKGEKQTSR